MSDDNNQIEELLAQVASLESKCRTLENKQNKVGLTFKRYPEIGDAQFLRDGMMPYLERVDKYSVVKDEPQSADHILIEGDNLPALVTLQSTHKGKVDVIYIDPPYNTGNKDFVYNDSYVSGDDGFRHSKWLSFMERRLVLAKELLSETGVIFVSIDDNEQAPLKMLMDSIFGARNFVTSHIWQSNFRPDNSARFVRKNSEYILCYAGNLSSISGFTPETGGSAGVPSLTKSSMKRSTLSFASGAVKFKIPDGVYEAGVLGEYTLHHEVTVSNGTNVNAFSLTGRVIWGQEKLDREIQQGTEILIKTKNFTPYTKKTTTRALPPLTILPSQSVKDVLYGRAEVANALGVQKFNYPKPTTLIRYLLNFISNPDAIVLDFFAGSGTTGHAVAALNAEDGGNRQAILVTNNFEQDGSENGIARDVTAARMKAVLTGVWADGKPHDALPGNLHYYRIDYKTPSFNGSTNATSMQSRFGGLAALATGSHLPVGLDGVPESAKNLREFVQAGSCALLRGPETLVVMWQDYSLLVLGEEGSDRDCVQLVLDEVKEINASLEYPLELVVYLPFDAVDVSDEFDFKNWKLVSFPERHFQDVTRVVEEMIGSDMLPATEVIDDSLGEESGPPVEPADASEEE